MTTRLSVFGTPITDGSSGSSGVTISVPASSLTLTGFTPHVSTSAIILSPAGTLALTGFAPKVSTGAIAVVPAGTLTLTGYAPSVPSVYILPPAGTLSLTTYTHKVSVAAIITSPLGSLSLTGNTPHVSTGIKVVVPAGTLTLTAYTPADHEGTSVHVPAGSLTLTGYTPLVNTGVHIFVLQGFLHLTGIPPAKVFAKPHGWIETLNGRNIEEVYIILVTLSHPNLTDDIRITNEPLQQLITSDAEGVISNDLEYIYIPFEIILPNLEKDAIPSSKISIDNVSRELIAQMSDITTPPSVSIQIVLNTDPDTVEYRVDGLKMVSSPYNELTVDGEFTTEYYANEPYPAPRFTPGRFPGLFRGRSVNTSV